ncbi:DUF2285 domain-containing protein [Pseudomonas sp. C1C7]|uniref:DNA -binding domain-containing protein n=1 Tax=Pseudomonas sp. C1C7 TaxID=2735272 RepID=UPI0015867789|nr:DUF2285 domain-containing protein [Pseudomonas sp. C1C7]NUT79245.1 DUF2285 domain-containing protein [Pseudomonas sp. C1C7]
MNNSNIAREVDFAWCILKTNAEFKKDLRDAIANKTSKSDKMDTLKKFEFIKYESENSFLKNKWGVLNTPEIDDIAGYTVFWNPEISKNSIEIRLCENNGPTLIDIFRLSNAKITGAIFEQSKKCIIKITLQLKFYQLVISDFQQADYSKSIQLCTPLTPKFSLCVKTAKLILELTNGNTSESTTQTKAARESILIANSIEDGTPHREIALKLFGLESVKHHWAPDSWMRAKIRYNINKTKQLIRGGYRDLI